MRIFVLEDDPERLRWFRERFLNHDVTYADSCAQADRFQPPYDLVCFDHDLGGRQMDDHEDCGEAFALKVRPQIFDQQPQPPFIVIHSYNPDGARRIRELFGPLTGVYIAPFKSGGFNRLLHIMLARWEAA